MKELITTLKNLKLKTPLLTASGTSGHSGEELNSLQGSEKTKESLGAFVTKGITFEKSDGNQEFQEYVITNNFEGASSCSAIDIDNDSDIDVLGTAWDANEVAIWLQN